MDEKRGRLITVLLVGGGVLVYAGTQASSFRPGQWSGALWAILLGLPFFVFGLLLYRNGRGAAWAENILQKSSQWLGVTPLQAALVAMSPVFGYISVLAAGFSKRMYSPGWAVTAWILGMALILAGGWRTSR